VLGWERLALTQAQANQYDLTPIIKRDGRYADGGEHEAIETEALRQEVLVTILRDRLDALVPEPLDRLVRREARQRKQMRGLLVKNS
jgi:hypothetical protein